MNEKEFTLEWEDEEICQVYHNGECMGTDEVVDKLNELTRDKIAFANELNKFESEVEKTLQKHYNYAENQRQKNLDNVMVHQAYDLLRITIKDIADDLGVDVTTLEALDD